jgi:alkaline phosphatase
VANEKWAYHAYSNTDSRTSEGFTLDETKSLIRPEFNKSLYDGTPSPYGNESLGVGGNITTYTDSAAGGTALATGVKVTNSRIGLDIKGNKLENLVEIAHSLNKKTGVVTSDEVVGATPASFMAHVPARYEADMILEDIPESNVDLVLAKTCSAYTNKKIKYNTLYTENGYKVIESKESITKDSDKLIGLFNGVAAKTDPRIPSLAELTIFALDFLDNEEGFFLMVEGANIDKQSHSNQTKLMLKELLGFNEAVDAAMNWADSRDDTLIVVTADHETGGLYYDRDNTTQTNIVSNIKWLSQNHSRTRVDIAIYGDISGFTNKFGSQFKTLEGLPYWDNTDVFRLCSWYLFN